MACSGSSRPGPITAIPQPKSWEDRQAWSNTNTGEVMPDVTTPVTWSMIQLLFYPLFRSVCNLAGADIEKNPVAGLVAGRVYFSINVGMAAGRPFGLKPENAARSDVAFGGGNMKMYHLGEFDIPDEDLPDLGFSWPRCILSLPRIIYSLLSHSPKRGDRARAESRNATTSSSRSDLTATSTADLARILTASLWQNVGDLDLLYLITSAPALLLFDVACRRWLGDQDFTLGYRLLAAQGGMADTEAGLDLWRLAELAHARCRKRRSCSYPAIRGIGYERDSLRPSTAGNSSKPGDGSWSSMGTIAGANWNSSTPAGPRDPTMSWTWYGTISVPSNT